MKKPNGCTANVYMPIEIRDMVDRETDGPRKRYAVVAAAIWMFANATQSQKDAAFAAVQPILEQVLEHHRRTYRKRARQGAAKPPSES